MSGALAQAFVRLRVDSSLVAADTAKGVEEGAAAADVESAGASAGERAAGAFNKAFRLGAIGVLAAAAVGAAAIKSAVDFQRQMTQIQTQAGASAAQVKQLSAAVLQLAPSTQQGPQQLAAALYHLKSVGMDNTAAMQALKTASDLAAVGGANLEETTNAIAAAWRSGITGAQNFGQAAATVNAIIGSGNMRMSDFVAALSTGILPAAKTFGVSLKQVGGAMALMTDEGVPAQLAATRLRMSLSLIGAPSATAAKQLKSIGLASTSLAQAMRSGGIIGAIGLLKQHISDAGLSAVQTAQLLSRAFGGGQSSSAIMTLINNFDVLKRKQDQINQGMSRYGPDVAAQRQTVQAQLDMLRSSLETIGVRMGDALLPPFTRLVHFLASDLLPAAVRLGGVLGGLFRNPAVDAFVGALLAVLVAVKGIIIATKLWAGAQLLVRAAMAASGIGIAIVAVAALAAGIAILWERSSTFRKIVEGAFRAVKTAASDVWDWLKGHWLLLAGILLAPFAPLIAAGYALYKLVGVVAHVFDSIKHAITSGFDSWWKSHGKEIEQVWNALWERVSAIASLAWGLITNVVRTGWNLLMGVLRPGIDLVETLFRAGWGYVSATTRAAWDLVSGVIRAAWDVIGGIVKVAVAGVEAVIKIAWDLIVGIFNVALDLITGHWSKAWDDIKATATQVWNAIKGFFSTALADFEHMFTSAWDSLLSGLKSWASDMLGYVRTIPGMILAALGDVGHLLWNAGKAIIGGLIGGLKSAISGIGHVMGSVASTIKSFLPFSPAKQGPLSGKGDPFYSGLSIGKKIAAGLLASIPDLKKAATGSVSQIQAGLSKATSEQAGGTKELGSLEGQKGKLQAERAKEESQIQKLIALREQEYKTEGKASAGLRREQENQIKELEKLRSAQESQVKQVDSVISILKKSLTQLRDEVTKLKESLARAEKAAAKAAAKSAGTSSSSGTRSSSSSGSGGSSGAQPADFTQLNQWLAETGPSPSDGGSWQGNPGPLGGFGLMFSPGGGPRPAGRYEGGPSAQDGSEILAALMAGKLDEVIQAIHAQPAKNAAGMAAAMDGVTRSAITRGNW
jgi:TP901 family phage tail tape measure protein